jgi:ABC-2 type transport system permease protein
LVLAALGILAAVNALYQAPQLLSNLSERTVKVAVVQGTMTDLAADLRRTPHVKLIVVPDARTAAADLISGAADASLTPLEDGAAGIRIESAGIFGSLASKTVTSVALRRQAGAGFRVVEHRAAEHGQLLGLLLPGLLTLTLVASAVGLAVGSLGSLRASGMLQRLRVTGVTPLPLLSAMVTANFLLTGSALVLLVVAAAARSGSAPRILPLATTAILGFALLSSAGLAFASRFKNAQNAAAASSLVLGLLTLPAVLPVPNLTSTTGRWLVTLSPSGAVTESFRAALNGADAQSLSLVLPVVTAWAVLLTLLAARFFRWDNDRG